MSEKRYVCRDCHKTYKTLTWYNKHIQKYNHNPRPIDLFDVHTIEQKFSKKIVEIIQKLSKYTLKLSVLEKKVENLKVAKVQVIYHDDPIERIKREEEAKIQDPLLREYRNVFVECIHELKEVLKEGKALLHPIEPGPKIIEKLEIIPNPEGGD